MPEPITLGIAALGAANSLGSLFGGGKKAAPGGGSTPNQQYTDVDVDTAIYGAPISVIIGGSQYGGNASLAADGFEDPYYAPDPGGGMSNPWSSTYQTNFAVPSPVPGSPQDRAADKIESWLNGVGAQGVAPVVRKHFGLILAGTTVLAMAIWFKRKR